MEIQELLNECEAKADKTIENFKRNLSSIRTGRASTSLLDRVSVDYYGTPTPVNQVANVSAPEPRLITISPWERTMLGEIEKAILKSDLGLNPNNDGTIICLEIPQLTEVKKSEKKKEITEDDSKEAQTKIQKITDAKIKQIDEIKDKKEKEVMEV